MVTLRLAAVTVNGQETSESQFLVDQLMFSFATHAFETLLVHPTYPPPIPHSVMRVGDAVVVAGQSWRPTFPRARERVTMWPDLLHLLAHGIPLD